MDRRFAMSVAGTEVSVHVRSRGPHHLEVQIDQALPVAVHGGTSAEGQSQWVWQQGTKVVAAQVWTGSDSDVHVNLRGAEMLVRVQDPRRTLLASLGLTELKSQAGPFEVKSPMPGRVVKLLIQLADDVEAGQPLVVVEAMKMENELRAPRDGKVTAVAVREGATVDAGARLIVIEAP